MNRYIIAILFVTLTGNSVFAADALVLTDTLKSAFEAKLLAENGMQNRKIKPASENEIKSPACACDNLNMKEITKEKIEKEIDNEENKEVKKIKDKKAPEQ